MPRQNHPEIERFLDWACAISGHDCRLDKDTTDQICEICDGSV